MDSNTWTHQCWLMNNNLYQTYANTGCYLEKLKQAITDRDRWQERVKRICAISMP